MNIFRILAKNGIHIGGGRVKFTVPVEGLGESVDAASDVSAEEPPIIEPAPTGASARSAENADRINEILSVLVENGLVASGDEPDEEES